MEEAMNLQPRVYVGTYKKYNEGSLKGGWLTLTDYKDYQSFVSACRKLHQDEHDAELMIQDTSNMPDGLDCSEWIDETDFNDILEAVAVESMSEDIPKIQVIDYSGKSIAIIGDTRDIKDKLKQLGGKFNPRLSCGAGWIFSKRRQEDLKQLLQNGKAGKTAMKSKTEDNHVIEEAKAEYVKVWGNDKRMVKYCQEKISNAVKLSDGRIVIIEKQKLKTAFCFGYFDYGKDYDDANEAADAARRDEEYFREKNLEFLEEKISLLKDSETSCEAPYLSQKSYLDIGLINIHKVVSLGCFDFNEQRHGHYTKLSKDDRKLILSMYEGEKKKVNKRIDAYLKRYGLSKVRVHTYWENE